MFDVHVCYAILAAIAEVVSNILSLGMHADTPPVNIQP